MPLRHLRGTWFGGDAVRFQPWRRRQRCTARRRGAAPRQAGCAVAAEEAGRRQRAPERWRDGAALGGVPGGRGHDGAADPRRSQSRYAPTTTASLRWRLPPETATPRSSISLLKAGADPNGAVRAGETPLMLAARTGQADAVKALLNAGANVDAKETWNGQTALMWAAAAGHGPVVQALIEQRRRHPRAFQRWHDAAPVCGAARRHASRPRVAGGGRGREGRRGPTARRRCSWR